MTRGDSANTSPSEKRYTCLKTVGPDLRGCGLVFASWDELKEHEKTHAPLSSKTTAFMDRIVEAHKLLVSIAHDLRRADDFDHAQDMSDAALYCRAAYNDLRLGQNSRTKPVRRRNTG